MTSKGWHGHDAIIEMRRIGNIVKVSAMHPASLTEVTIQGTADTPETRLRQVALDKLSYVLRKNGVDRGRPPPDEPR